MSGVREDRKGFDAPSARAKLFQHGGSQAVRLPKAFRFEGAEVNVRREGDAVILEPVKQEHPRTAEEWAAFWARIDERRGGELLVRPPQPEWRDRDYDL